MAKKPASVEEYIDAFPEEIQVLLEQMRRTIKKAAPKAEEMISYNMPLYKLNGMLVSFAAWKTHIGLYPTPALTGALKKQLGPYEGAKSTLRFPLDKKLPISAITKVVKLRVKENAARVKRKITKRNKR